MILDVVGACWCFDQHQIHQATEGYFKYPNFSQLINIFKILDPILLKQTSPLTFFWKKEPCSSKNRPIWSPRADSLKDKVQALERQVTKTRVLK